MHSSTNFTVPRGVKKIDCFCVGGGGCGTAEFSINFSPYASGSASSVGSICNANGGCSSLLGGEGKGGNGGSGGGAVWNFNSSTSQFGAGGNGGSDGSDGGKVNFVWGGSGQGTTTRYFGESNGTLYAGGGGGCSYWDDPSYYFVVAAGGAGGGGNGGVIGGSFNSKKIQPCNGQANTGGGAGGSMDGTATVSSFRYAGYGGGGGGYTSTSLAQSVTPGGEIAVVVGAGGVSNYNINGGSGTCIIRWGKQ